VLSQGGAVAPTAISPTAVAPAAAVATAVAPAAAVATAVTPTAAVATAVAPAAVAPTAAAPAAAAPSVASPGSTSATQGTSAAAPSASDLFDTAARIERAQPDQAAAIYRRLASGDTPWAPNALFALARLEADRGHRADAVRLLQAYLARYPRGMNTEDARDLLRRLQ
jgi:hypothetical protein